MEERINVLEDIATETTKMKHKKIISEDEESVSELWDNLKHPNICVIAILKEKGKDRKYWINNDWNYSKFVQNYKSTYPHCSMNPRHKKPEGN